MPLTSSSANEPYVEALEARQLLAASVADGHVAERDPVETAFVAAAVAPVISSTSPSYPTATGFRQSFIINGSNFGPDATVTLRDVTHGVSYPNRAVLSRSGSTGITITPNFGTTSARWAVSVTNPGAAPTPEHPFDVVLPNTLAAPANIAFVASPHHSSRGGVDIDTIVIHTVEGSYTSAINTFLNPSSRVSAHYVISPTGTITQMVPLDRAAWHATYYNSRSIGIEMAGFAGQASTWTAQNLAALTELTAWLALEYDVPIVRPTGDARDTATCRYAQPGLVAHAQVQPGCDPDLAVKSDPGPYFPWSSYLRDVQERLSSVARLMPDGTLSLTGTAGADAAEVRVAGQSLTVTRGARSTSFTAASVRRLAVQTSGGADRVVLSGGSHTIATALPRLALEVSDGTAVAIQASQDLASLSVAPTAMLDLGTHDLTLRLNSPALLSYLTNAVRTARNSPSGPWRGPGITSAAARSNPLTGLAVLPGKPDSASILIVYTYNGDASGDGVVNADDYFRIDQGFLAQPPNALYAQGDFNFDGRVNADDYFLIDQAFLGQGAPQSMSSPVRSVVTKRTSPNPRRSR